MFSLALTVLEAGSGADLPPNGPLWHEYRRAGIPDLPHISAEFNALLKVRSSCAAVVVILLNHWATSLFDLDFR